MNSSELLRDDFHLGKMGQSLDFLPFEKISLWKFVKEEKKLLGSDLREDKTLLVSMEMNMGHLAFLLSSYLIFSPFFGYTVHYHNCSNRSRSLTRLYFGIIFFIKS